MVLKRGTEAALELSVLFFGNGLVSDGVEGSGCWAGRSVVFKTSYRSGGPRLNKFCVNQNSAQISPVVALFSQDTNRRYAGYGTVLVSQTQRSPTTELNITSIPQGSEPMHNRNAHTNNPCPIRVLLVCLCCHSLLAMSKRF